MSNRLDTSAYGTYTWSVPCFIEGRPDGTVAVLFPRESRVVTKKEIVKTISEEIGLTQLKTTFLDAESKPLLGAYYAYVRRLSSNDSSE